MLPYVIGIGLAWALHFLAPKMMDAYTARIVVDTGIAIILAVSLNIVNGMTGQFSIGHAGFMAVGAYLSG